MVYMSAASSASKQPYSLTWIALLGLLTALGPLSIDMYLPALPSMADNFQTTTASISSSIPAYFLGLAIGQLVYGSLSDRIGRKTPLYIGLIIYIVGSFLCAMAQSEWMLIAARILQALGGCVGVVMARAAIRDCFDLNTSVQALAHMAMILGIAPIIAPMIGTVLIQFFSWHSIFILLGMIGTLTLLCVHYGFKETLPAERRLKLSLTQILLLYGSVLKDRTFRTPMLAMGLFSGLLFCYITSASALLMEQYSLSEKQFALAFGANALGIMLFSFLNGKLVKRIGALPLLQFGGTMQLAGVLLLGIALTHPEQGIYGVMAGLFVVASGIGLTGPNATALALAHQKQRAGIASALLGSFQFLFGLLAGVILHHLKGTTLQNMTITMLIYVLLGLFCVYVMRIQARKRPVSKA